MKENKNKSNSFILQAGILAAAGIITRIIGLLYRSPLDAVVGKLGMGYYSSAYSYYTIILLISSYSIPSAMSKVIAQKLAVKEYRNAHRLFIGALIYVCFIGGIASLFLFFGAGLFVEKTTIPVLRCFAPTIFAYGLLGVLRGYFQAHKSMVQTSVSQILEQIANAAVSIGAAYIFIKLAFGSMEIPTDQNAMIDRAVKGAMGSALGTGAGVIVALLFMLFVYSLNRNIIHNRIKRDRHTNVDSYSSIIKTITFVITPFILSTAVYNLCAPLNTKIYTDIYPKIKSLDLVTTNSRWGIFSNQTLTISNIPIAFASAMAAAMIPSVAQLIAAKDIESAREKIGVAVKTTMLISIPSAVGLFALAKPVTSLLFFNTKDELELAGRALMALSLSVVFYALSTLNSSILQGLGKVNTPIINAGIALFIQTVISITLLFFTPLDVYAIAIANTVYSGIMCVLNQLAVRRAVGYRQEIVRTFILPFVAASVMGLSAWLVYRLIYLVTSSMRLGAVLAIITAVPVYFVMLIIVKGVTEEELRGIPKGYLIVKLAKKVKLM